MLLNQILHRFDHAKPGSFHLKLILVAGSTWIWIAYGVTIVGFIIPSLKLEWNISSGALGLLAGIGMLGMLVGAILAGTLADHFGRRWMLAWIMVYQALLFMLSGLAGSYSLLLVLRFFLGMGIGAALPVAGTLVSEFSPNRIRGMLMVHLNTFWALGASLSAIIGYLLVIPYGWRPAMFFGALAALSGLLVQLLLPESFRFLMEKGRMDQLQRENSRIQLQQDPSSPALSDNASVVTMADKNSGLWSRKFAAVTATLWYLWIGLNFLYQGVYVWLPTLLSGEQAPIGRSFLVTLFISLGQLPGTLLAALLADKFSRRKLLIISQGLVGLSTLLFPLFGSAGWVMLTGFLIMLFNGMAMGLGHPFTAELYPTRIRARANGWASGIGRIGGVIAPLTVAAVMQAGGGLPLIFSLLAIAPFSTMLVLGVLRRETTGRTLEEISY